MSDRRIRFRPKTEHETLLRRREMPTPAAHRQKGLWNFLTWSFFIAQVMAAETFVGSPAQASQGSEAAPLPSGADTAPGPAASLPPVAGAHGPQSEDGSTASQTSGTSGTEIHHGADDHLASAKYPATDVGEGRSVGAHEADASQTADPFSGGEAPGLLGGDGNNAHADQHSDAGFVAGNSGGPLDLGIDNLLSPVLGAAGGLIGSVEQIVAETTGPILATVGNIAEGLVVTLDHALSPLLGTVGDTVGSVGQIAGDLLTPVTSAADGLVASLGATLDHALAPLSDVVNLGAGSVGQIVNQTVEPVLAPVGDVVGSLSAILDHALGGGGSNGGILDLAANVTAGVTGHDSTASTAQVVGDLAAAATSLVDAADGPLLQNPLETIVGSVAGPASGMANALGIGSTGSISIADAPAASGLHLDDLFSHGTYTPYNLAINIGPAASTIAVAQSGSSGPVVDAALDVAHGTGDPTDHGGPAQLHGALPSVLDELHLRGAIDSLGL